MRNTSARGFTPRQNADFFEGSVDLSEWFSVGEVIDKKIQNEGEKTFRRSKKDDL